MRKGIITVYDIWKERDLAFRDWRGKDVELIPGQKVEILLDYDCFDKQDTDYFTIKTLIGKITICRKDFIEEITTENNNLTLVL